MFYMCVWKAYQLLKTICLELRYLYKKKNKYRQQLLLKAVATSHHKLYNHALKKEREIRTDYSTALVF